MEGNQTDASIDVHLRDYLWVLRKHLGAAITFFIVVVVAVTVVTFKSQPVYQANAEIYIERETPELVNLRELYDLGATPDEYRKTQHQLIRSRQIAEAVFRREGLGRHETFRDAADPVEAFRDLITVTPKEGTYLATVSVESTDPAEAADWTNALLDEYISYVELRHRTTSSEVQKSLNLEIPRLRSKLLEAETRLIEFQRQGNVMSFEKQQEILFRKLQELDTALTRVQKEKIKAQARLSSLATPSESGSDNGGGVPVLPEDLETPVLSVYRKREGALLELLAERASHLGPRHPQLKEVQDKLKKVRGEMRTEVLRVRRTLEESLALKQAEEESLQQLKQKQMEKISGLDEKSNRYQELKSVVESNRRMYRDFLERRKQIESASGFGATNISIVDRALPPKAPVRPKKWLNITLAFIVGLLGGVALAFFFEYLDDTVKTPDDVKDVLGLPFLGLIPVIPRQQMEESRGLVTGDEQFSSIAEAFRTVRTGIRFALSGEADRARVFLLTSPGPQEGKTVNAVNLAVTLAKTASRVLLVDGDLRKPMVHRMLGLTNEAGLSTACSGGAPLDEVVQKSSLENLWVVTSGPIPPNPSELLGSEAMLSLLTTMGKDFDVVLVDTPPTGAVTDPVVLASRVDGILLVVSAGKTRRKAAQHCAEQLSRVNGNVVGVILNAFKFSRSSYYRYAYYHRPYYRRSEGGPENHEQS